MYKNWNYSSNKNQISDDKVEQDKIENNQSEDWLVIPYSYEINDIIYQAHTSAGSHLSIQKTLEEIRKIGYRWENYESYVRQFWLDWDIWGGRHQKRLKNNAVKHIESRKPTEKYQADTVYLSDYLTKNTKQYLLTVIHHFSKFGWAALISDKQAATVLIELKNIFHSQGYPKILQTDNGKEFVNDKLKSFLDKQSIKHITGAPYQPQSQGAVEAFNRTIQKFLYLAKDMNKNSFCLEDSVHDFWMHYNNRTHSTTKFTPFEIIEKKWDKEFLEEVYKNTVLSREESKEIKFENGLIVRISSNLRKVGSNSKFLKYYEPKIASKLKKREDFKIKGKILEERRNTWKVQIITKQNKDEILQMR